jgi:hypothetical protein
MITAAGALPALSELTGKEALSISLWEFMVTLAQHLGQTFEEIEHILRRVPYNLLAMIDNPDGYAALALLLSPPGNNLPMMRPTIH